MPRRITKHKDQEAVERLKAVLTEAFAAPDSAYLPLTVAQVLEAQSGVVRPPAFSTSTGPAPPR